MRKRNNQGYWHMKSVVGMLLVLCALLVWHSAALAQASGVIEGQVVVGEGELPAGLEVELLFLPNGQGPPAITPQPLPADGSFRFAEIDTAPQHRYLVRVVVDGEENYSDLLAFELGETSKQVALRLFERTTDASALSLAQANFILDLQPSGWVVLAFYQYFNAGEQIIENLTNPPAFFPLPTEATNVRFVEGFDFEGVAELATGFSYTGPFAAGEIPLIFSYVLPYSEGEQTFTLPVGTNASEVRVLIPELGQKTTTEDMVSGGTQEFEGFIFELFEAENVMAEQTFTFQLSDLPPPPTPDPNAISSVDSVDAPAESTSRVEALKPLEQLPIWAPLVPMSLAILGAVGYLFARPAPSQAERRQRLRQQRDTLVAEVAMLDIRFEAGAIGEQTHRRQRKALKRQLKDILRELGLGEAENIKEAIDKDSSKTTISEEGI